MTPAEFQRLKDRIQGLETEAAQAQGAIDQLLSTLKEEHGCSSVDDAEKRLKTLEREIARDERKLDKEWQAFEDKWGDKLEGVP